MQPGEIRNIKGQRKYSYNSNNDNLKGSSQNTFDYKYDIEMKEGYHSLDDEEEIEEIKCYEDYLEIYSTTKEIIEWKAGDSLSGSEMWKCSSVITRKIEYVDYEGIDERNLHKFYVKTTSAGFSDFFENAKVKFENHIAVDHILKQEQQLKRSLKQQENEINVEELEKQMEHEKSEYYIYNSVSEPEKVEKKDRKHNSELKKADSITFDMIQPEGKSFREITEGIPVSFEVKGCYSSACNNLKFRFDLMTWGTIRDTFTGLYWQINANCGTSGSCSLRYRFITDYPNSFPVNSEVFFRVTITDGNGKVLMDEVECDNADDRFWLNTYYTLFISPEPHQVIEPKSNTVKFEFSQRVLSDSSISTIKLYVCESEVGIDDCDYYYNVDKTQTQLNINFGESRVYQAGGEYYFKTTINGFVTEGDIFRIAEEEPPVVLTSPSGGEYYKKGDQINIEWICNNPSLSIDIYLKYSKSFAVDPSTHIGTFSCSLESKAITVESGVASDEYYIDITYKLSGNIIKSHSTSGYFSINMPQKIQLIETQHNKDAKQLKVHYKVSEYLGDIYVSVRQQFPTVLPLNLVLSGTSQEKISNYYTNYKESQNFYYTSGSIFKTYVEFKYDCVIKSYLCKTERYFITDNSIPYTIDLGYNLDTNHQVVNKSIELINFGCPAPTDGEGVFMQSLCKMLTSNYVKEIGLTSYCENCYFDIKVGLMNFELDMDFLQIKKLALRIDAAFDYYIKLVNTLNGKFHTNFTLPIPNPGSIPSSPFKLKIGSVNFELGPYVGFATSISLDATVMLQTIATFHKNHVFTYVIDTTKSQKYQVTTTVPNEQINTIEVYGTATLTVIPKLTARLGFKFQMKDFNFVDTEASISVGLKFDIQFSYPPFSGNTYYGTTKDHFLRLDSKFFISFDAYYMILSSPMTTYSKELFSISKGFAFLEYESNKKPVSFTMKINKQLDDFDASLLQYEIGKIVKQSGYSTFNPYDVSLTKGSNNEYQASLMSSSSTDQMARKAVDKIQSIKQSSSDDGTFTYSIRNSITLCEISNCQTCSLDMKKCEQCNTNYYLNNGVCSNTQPENPSNPTSGCTNGNTMKGYVMEQMDTQPGGSLLYKIDYCYNENGKQMKYVYDSSKKELKKCEYSSSSQNCAIITGKSVYTTDSQLPKHTLFSIQGDKSDCSDHKTGSVKTILFLDTCINMSNSYYKYEVSGNSVVIKQYSDNSCRTTGGNPTPTQQVASCDVCSNGKKFYCSKHSMDFSFSNSGSLTAILMMMVLCFFLF